jgi:dynein heavy chain
VIKKFIMFLFYRLEDIGASAAKEFSLEKALERMKFEWKDMAFELIPYRETVC